MRALALLLALCPAAGLALVASRCGPGRCQRFDTPLCVVGSEAACGCAPSVRGTPCVECAGQGHVADGACVCARARDSDPNAACAKIVPVVANATATRTRTVVACNCSHSWEEGMFASADAPRRTGLPNPPRCDACVSPGVGPAPGSVLDVEAGVAPQACTRYGGFVPGAGNLSVWTACSGRGAWNASTRACDCDEGWAARETQHAGFRGERASTCDVCAPLRGPPLACDAVFTPDPLTGLPAECGGHGAYVSGACRCFTNSTAGFWALARYETLATVWDPAARARATRPFNASTCAACLPGHDLARGCA